MPPTTVRRALVALVAAVVAITVAACGGSSDGTSSQDDFTSKPAKNLPRATDLAKDGSTIAIGDWGVVKDVTGGKATVLAIKITGLNAGKVGDFKEIRGAGDLSTVTPYFVSYSWANIEGDPQFSPNQTIGTPTGSLLLVPKSFEKCKTPAALDYSGSLGDEQHGCAVLAMDAGAPLSLDFDSLGGSRHVSFTLPSGV